MPTYEYACTRCGQHIEVFQRLSEEALTTCGVCGGPLRKVFHPAGIVFKGSGFYATDSRAKPKSSGDDRARGDKADKKDGTDKGDTKGSGAPKTASGTGSSNGSSSSSSSSSGDSKDSSSGSGTKASSGEKAP
jgi:putative FmdB family regulatory protein